VKGLEQPVTPTRSNYAAKERERQREKKVSKGGGGRHETSAAGLNITARTRLILAEVRSREKRRFQEKRRGWYLYRKGNGDHEGLLRLSEGDRKRKGLARYTDERRWSR